MLWRMLIYAHQSESLQQASISLPKAYRLITRQIEILKSRKETGGDYYREACEAIENGIFHGVQVVMETGRKPKINMAPLQITRRLHDVVMTAVLWPVDVVMLRRRD